MATENNESTRESESLFSETGFPYWGIYGTGSDQYPDNFWPYPGMPVLPPAFLNNQKRGEALPYYLNWHQLRSIRDRSRLLCSTNEYAISAITNLQSFIVGSGFTYRALPMHDDEHDDDLIGQVQRVIDIFCGANQLDLIEAETVYRDAVDGETFLRLFYQPSGLIQLRFVEPEHIYPQGGDGDPEHSFGIETDPEDIASVRGYRVVENPLHTGWTTKFVPARNMVHSKRNVTSGAKRGLPLLYPVEANLRRAEELLAAMSVTTKTRAKIAMIRRIEGASKSAAERLKTEAETGTALDPTTGGVNNVEKYPLGTILSASKNIDYEFPQHNAGSETGIQVLQAELRAVAARLVIPEMMLSADASGGTYSSQLVAEAPSTRNFERIQRYYRSLFGESRAPRHESLVWRQVAYAVHVGLIPREALSKVKVIAQAPAIIPRDPDKAAAANKTYYDMGVKSPQGICAELGGDWKVVQRERKDAGLPENPMDMGMQGMGAPQQDPDQFSTEGMEEDQFDDEGNMVYDEGMFE